MNDPCNNYLGRSYELSPFKKVDAFFLRFSYTLDPAQSVLNNEETKLNQLFCATVPAQR